MCGFFFHDRVDQAPVLRLLGGHEEVPLHRSLDLFERPLAVLGVDPRYLLALAEDLLGVDLDIGGLALDALRKGLVDEDLRVRQRNAHARGAAGEKDRSPLAARPVHNVATCGPTYCIAS